MKKYATLLAFILCATSATFAQNTPSAAVPDSTIEKSAPKGVWYVGGSVGVVFGSDAGLGTGKFHSANISPQVGYQFNRWLSAGAGISYFTDNQEIFYVDYSTKNRNQSIGINAYGRINPFPIVFIQLQPEVYYTDGSLTYTNDTPKVKYDSKIVPTFLVGWGFEFPVSKQVIMNTQMQYDVIQNERSPYNGSRFLFSIGVNVALKSSRN